MSDGRFDTNANPYLTTQSSLAGFRREEYARPTTCPYCQCGPRRMAITHHDPLWTTLRCPECGGRYKIRPKTGGSHG